MNTPTPTPEEHKALWTKLFNLAHDEIFDDFEQSDGPAHQLIADSEAKACDKLRAQLTTERDQLRAENATLRAAQKACEACDEPTAFEVGQLRARAERAEANETVALAHWNKELERAMKAEAELAAAKERLRSEAMDDYASIKDLQRELAIERARLNWLETPSGMDWQWEPERLTVSRASIDAGMKEGVK